MRYLTGIIFVTLLPLGVLAAPASKAGASRIESLSQARYTALNHHDASAFGKVYADDYQFVSWWGKRYGIKFLKQWVASGSRFKLTPSNYKVRISPKGDMAYAVMDLHEVYYGPDGKAASQDDTVFTEIYERRQGQWKLVQAHNSKKSKAPWER